MLALDRRINLKGGLLQDGRKWDDDYQRGLVQDQDELHRFLQQWVNPAINRWRTKDVQARFGHLLERGER